MRDPHLQEEDRDGRQGLSPHAGRQESQPAPPVKAGALQRASTSEGAAIRAAAGTALSASLAQELERNAGVSRTASRPDGGVMRRCLRANHQGHGCNGSLACAAQRRTPTQVVGAPLTLR
jgi:hypothetical protein